MVVVGPSLSNIFWTKTGLWFSRDSNIKSKDCSGHSQNWNFQNIGGSAQNRETRINTAVL